MTTLQTFQRTFLSVIKSPVCDFSCLQTLFLMRPKRQPSRDEQFTLTSNPNQQLSENPSAQHLLNEIYTRIKAKSNVNRQANPSDSNVVLISYLSHSQEGNPTKETTYNSDSIHQLADSLQQVELPQHRHKKTKKFSHNQRMKTDIDELDSVSEMDFLQRENLSLKQKLSKCQKRIIALQSFQCEAEYMRKLILIQDSEINKLRRMLKATKQNQLSLIQQENRHPQACSQGIKEKRNEPILISDHSYCAQIDATHKKKKCFHKTKAQGLTYHPRTDSIEDLSNQKYRSFHSKSREEMSKKNSCKGRKDKNLCR